MRNPASLQPLRLLVVLGVAVLLGPASARAIVCGEYVLGDLNPGESDVHTFVAAAGDRVMLQPGSTTNQEMTATLAGPGGAPIGLISLPYTDLFLSPQLPSAGAHSITVTHVHPDHEGDYGLTLESVTGSFNGVTNWLPNPVCGGLPEPFAPGGIGGTRVLGCGETFPPTSAVNPFGAGASDSFTFHARAGDVLHLGTGGFDWRAFLFDPTGEPVGFGSGPFCDAGDAPGEESLCTTTPLPVTGVYTLAVVAEDGAYRITLESVGGTFNSASNGPPSPICGLPADGTRSLCTPLPPRSGGVGYGDSDAWTFIGQAGDPATFSVTNPTPLPGLATATLFGPDATPVTGNTLPLSGVYTLLVARDDDNVGDGQNVPPLPYAVSIDPATCRNACDDRLDNDGDGQIDSADLFGCLSRDDLSEQPECNDGIDNDGDGGIDVGTRTQPGDLACFSPNFFTEDPACSDGADNEGDKRVDFDGLAGATRKDPQCNDNPSWLSELVPGPVSCGLGPELALLLPVLAVRHARRLRATRRPEGSEA